MKKPFFLSFIFLLFILYYFLFPLTADKEHIWTPGMVQALDQADGKTFSLLEDPVVVDSGAYSGVLRGDEASLIRRNEPSLNRIFTPSHTFETAGPNRAVLVKRMNNKTSFYTGPGGPLVLNNRYYLADLSAGSLREVDTAGQTLWAWEGVSPITALAAGDKNTAFGTLDGEVYLFRKDGRRETVIPLPDRGDSIIYGLSLSQDDSLMAVVAGLDPQSLLLYREKSPLVYEQEGQTRLDSRYARPVKVSVPPGGSAVWLEQPGRILRISENGASRDYPVPGTLLEMIPDEERGILHFLSSQGAAEGQIILRSIAGYSLLTEHYSGAPRLFALGETQIFMVLQEDFLMIKRERY